MGQRLPSSRAMHEQQVAGQHQEDTLPPSMGHGAELCGDRAQEAWRRILAAAAGSPTPDALAKAQWMLQTGRTHCRLPLAHADVCGAAAASGDLALLAWLRDHGFPWRTAEVLAAVVRYADLPFVQRLAKEGGYLRPAGNALAWASGEVVAAAAASARDAVTKLRWLAGRGASLESNDAVMAAAGSGPRGVAAAAAAHARRQRWPAAARRGLLRRLAAGGPGRAAPDAASRRAPRVVNLCRRFVHVAVLSTWPANTPADGERLVQAARLVANGHWGDLSAEVLPQCPPLELVAGRQPWAVWAALRELLPPAAQDMGGAAHNAASSGCEATLEGLVGMGVLQAHGSWLAKRWYVDAAAKGDRGTLECLARLGLPLGEGALVGAVGRGAPLAALQWLVAQGVALAEWERAAVARDLQCSALYRTARDAWLHRVLGLQAEGGP